MNYALQGKYAHHDYQNGIIAYGAIFEHLRYDEQKDSYCILHTVLTVLEAQILYSF